VGQVGKLDLRQGSLVEVQHRPFMTSGVTAAWVNNFNGVFGERSSPKTQRTLDDYVAALFAFMSDGARLASLHPLPLGPSRSLTNAWRARHGLKESWNASFFEYEEIDLGPASESVSWSEGSGNNETIRVYLYTRVRQCNENSIALPVFLCCNPLCENAKAEVFLPAFFVNKSNDEIAINKCQCRFEPHNLRN